MKQYKSLAFFFATIFVLFTFVNSSSFTEKTEKSSKKQLDLTVPKGAKIFYQGWGKYFYTSKNIVKPTEFFLNKQFFSQRYPAKVAKSGDAYGPLVIPDDSSFFFVLFKDTLTIYSARDEIIRHAADTLNIEDILPVPEDDFLLGGIKNLGKYQAGFCMQTKVKSPAAYNANAFYDYNWFFCFSSNNEKSKFLKSLAKIKILNQRSKDQIVTAQAVSDQDLEKKTKNEKNTAEDKDGKMVLLQDWTECTLKCGGGKSYQQFMCIPPKAGGKPCKGDLVNVKDCNTDPCPEVRSADDDKNATSGETSPEIKYPIPTRIERFSTRKNRYIRCHILEEDAQLEVTEADGSTSPRFLKLVINHNTVSFYGGANYMELNGSYNIPDTEFKVLEQPCCFELKDKRKKNKYCSFQSACEPETNSYVKKISAAFTDFKTVCTKGKSTKIIDDTDKAKIKEEKQKTMAVQNFEVESEKAEKANEKLEDEINNKVFQKIKETQKSGLKALEREVMIEDLIKKDEERKEETKEQVIYQELDAEKRKNKSINQQIKEKELAADFQMQDYRAQKDVKEAKAEIVEQIEVNREKLKKQIEEIRKQAKKRRETLQSKVRKLRSKITNKLIKANRAGNKDTCIAGLTNDGKRTAYCSAAFNEDIFDWEYCNSQDNFCYSCCDNEFGLLKPSQRDDCYETCDSEREKLDKAAEDAKKPKKKNQFQWKAGKRQQN